VKIIPLFFCICFAGLGKSQIIIHEDILDSIIYKANFKTAEITDKWGFRYKLWNYSPDHKTTIHLVPKHYYGESDEYYDSSVFNNDTLTYFDEDYSLAKPVSVTLQVYSKTPDTSICDTSKNPKKRYIFKNDTLVCLYFCREARKHIYITRFNKKHYPLNSISYSYPTYGSNDKWKSEASDTIIYRHGKIIVFTPNEYRSTVSVFNIDKNKRIKKIISYRFHEKIDNMHVFKKKRKGNREYVYKVKYT
jgi:hypothetical protein